MLVPLYDKPEMKKFSFLFLALVLVLVGYQYSRPVPTVQANSTLTPPKTSGAITLPWPAYGQGALAAQGYGMLLTHGEQKAVPMASIAKVVTALAVLKQKPLDLGQQGPIITINSDDVAIYNNYYQRGGSVVKVEAGEQISEYQALQALLIPSANNIADTLARWAFGSMDNYVAYANSLLQGLTLQQTKIADASGFSPDSVSSAQDLVKLGLAALDNPLLAAIVSQETAELPLAGSVDSVNWLLGEDGVVGIKTGNTDQAGGCFLFAAKQTIGGQNITLVGALMQAPDLNTVIIDARVVAAASDSGFESVKVISKGQTVGIYKTPWGATADAVASQDLNILAWRGSQVQVAAKLNKIEPSAKANTFVGSISATSGQKTASVPVTLNSNLTHPPWYWRLLR